MAAEATLTRRNQANASRDVQMQAIAHRRSELSVLASRRRREGLSAGRQSRKISSFLLSIWFGDTAAFAPLWCVAQNVHSERTPSDTARPLAETKIGRCVLLRLV